jgi:glycylpeptide N-tetradecanoyltransferase
MQVVPLNVEENIDSIILLLNNNYVESKTDNYKYVYSKEFITWYLNIYPSSVMGIYDNNILIAMITGRIVPTILNKIDKQIAEISFMCVHKDYRNKKLCPLLISTIEAKMMEMGADDALFSTHHNMGKSLCGINHMLRVINPRKLVSVGYLRCDTTIEKLEYHYRVEPVKNKNKRLDRITENNIELAFELYKKWYSKMTIHTNYTLELFKQVILSNNIIGYLLYDRDIAIDMISYYIIPSNVTRRNILMNDGYIYHYTNNSNSMHKMMSLLLFNEKDNIDTLCIMNTMGLDINDFEDLKFVPTTSDYNYYLFKNKEITIDQSKMGVVLL